MGYFGELLYDWISAETHWICTSITILVVSMCQHQQAFLKMFQHLLRKLDRPDQNQSDKELLHKLIKFHILVKE